MSYELIAGVDLGSNSFRLQIGRVVGNRIHPLDSLKETVRLGSGLTREKLLDHASQQRAISALRRFGERLRGFEPETVRAVTTDAM
ncbi:MAG: exopolyphosphatase, partial [Candidatus Accumulibacter necessarius]|uniref:Ppx/GppA phosphatase family protein n=1 Tax=Candidatus Accumulibacter necessarius TaxID=2954386 RepID=UPI002FC52000